MRKAEGGGQEKRRRVKTLLSEVRKSKVEAEGKDGNSAKSSQGSCREEGTRRKEGSKRLQRKRRKIKGIGQGAKSRCKIGG